MRFDIHKDDNIIHKDDNIERCIISLADGNIDSMDDLYKLIKHDVYAFALSKVCNKFDADDIMQDTFIRIYENAKFYVPQGKPLAWIFTIETNIINRYFQLKNRTQSLDEGMLNKKVSNSSTSSNLLDSEQLGKLLKHLNEFERQIISLHLVSDLKFKEIAQYFNKPLSTVLSKYNRSIKKLQKLVKEGNYEKK